MNLYLKEHSKDAVELKALKYSLKDITAANEEINELKKKWSLSIWNEKDSKSKL